MKNKKLFFLTLVAIFLASFCFFIYKFEYKGGLAFKWRQDLHVGDIHFVKIGEQMIKVDLAVTEKEQERGLSGRISMEENEGMLFIFSKLKKNYFWMKDMNFPIDIIWIDENFRIIYIKKNVLPSSYPESFGPSVDNRYVLEILGGFSERNNLKIGDSVSFLP